MGCFSLVLHFYSETDHLPTFHVIFVYWQDSAAFSSLFRKCCRASAGHRPGGRGQFCGPAWLLSSDGCCWAWTDQGCRCVKKKKKGKSSWLCVITNIFMFLITVFVYVNITFTVWILCSSKWKHHLIQMPVCPFFSAFQSFCCTKRSQTCLWWISVTTLPFT